MSLLTNLARLVPPTFPPGFCPKSLQELANALIGGTQLTFLIQSGNMFYNFGSTTPAPENRIYPWLYTPNGRWYIFMNGLWAAPMDSAERELEFRKVWKPTVGTPESALWSLDEGDGTNPSTNPPTPFVGASWEVDHDFDDLIAIGADSIAGVSATAGASTVTLNDMNLPEHEHEIGVPVSDVTSDEEAGTLGLGDNIDWNSANDTDKVGKTRKAGETSPTAFSIIPPVVGVFWVKPTARQYYTLPP